jgi:hypothetical protein
MFSLDDPQIHTALQTVVLAIISLLGTMVLALLTWLSASVKRWLAVKGASAAFLAGSDRVFAVTASLVREAEQTLVREAKAATEDGKLTKEDGIRIRDEVLKRSLDHLGLDGVIDLQNIFGHKGDKGVDMIRRILRTAIESRVSEQREG